MAVGKGIGAANPYLAGLESVGDITKSFNPGPAISSASGGNVRDQGHVFNFGGGNGLSIDQGTILVIAGAALAGGYLLTKL